MWRGNITPISNWENNKMTAARTPAFKTNAGRFFEDYQVALHATRPFWLLLES